MKQTDSGDFLALALPSKGRLNESAESFFARAGLPINKPNRRQYRATIPNLPSAEVVYQRARDILDKVGEGSVDIGVTGGRVARVAERIAESEGRQVVRAHGMIVTPGLIDIHAHVYDGVSGVSIEPDVVGIAKGVTTVVDAGSSGATTFPGFKTYVAAPARTRVYALLNVSSPGIGRGIEARSASV